MEWRRAHNKTDKIMHDRTFEVNTLAHFWTLKAFLPSLVANGEGHIVNVASMLGTMGVAGAGEPRKLLTTQSSLA